MQLMFSYADGKIVEGVVLSASVDRMRISVPDYEDVLELRSEQNLWILESGERVEIESVLATDSSTIFPGVRPLTRSALGGAVI
jgi:hypothetical protein